MGGHIQTAVILCLMLLNSPRSFATDITHYWETFSNRPYEEPAYPDRNVWYERIRIRINTGAEVALKITDRAPSGGRYFGFAVYDQRTGTWLGSNAAIESTHISQSTSGEYSVYALSNRRMAETPEDINAFRFYDRTDDERYTYVEIWYRIYSYTEEERPRLPQVSVVDPVTLVGSAPAPAQMVGYTPSALVPYHRGPPKPGTDRVLRFYRAENINGLYANPHTTYILTQLDHPQNGRDNAVIRFREPPVRDWSVCMIGGFFQQSGACLSRSTAVRDGSFIVITLGKADPRTTQEKSRINFLPWTKFRMGSGILYRNLLPADSDPWSFARIPALPENGERDPQRDVSEFAADRWIGDYGPKGMQCKWTPRNGCDWRRDLRSLSR